MLLALPKQMQLLSFILLPSLICPVLFGLLRTSMNDGAFDVSDNTFQSVCYCVFAVVLGQRGRNLIRVEVYLNFRRWGYNLMSAEAVRLIFTLAQDDVMNDFAFHRDRVHLVWDYSIPGHRQVLLSQLIRDLILALRIRTVHNIFVINVIDVALSNLFVVRLPLP